MSTVVAFNPDTTITKREFYYVQLKREWWQEWTTVDFLTPVQWMDCIAPQVPVAWLRWDAGRINRALKPAGSDTGFEQYRWMPDDDLIAHGFLQQELDGVYVRIGVLLPPSTEYPDGEFGQLWVGVISGEAKSPYGYEDYATLTESLQGVQTITALGLAHLLNKKVIDRAWAVNRITTETPDGIRSEVGYGAFADSEVVEIEWAPDFNRTYRRNAVTNNKSHPPIQGVRYQTNVFSEDPPLEDTDADLWLSGSPWNDQEVAEYLLRFWQPMGHIDDGTLADPQELQFVSTTLDTLYGRYRSFRQHGLSVFDILNVLASEDMGLGWYVSCPDAVPGAVAEVVFFSRFDRRLSFLGSTIQANPVIIDDLPVSAEQAIDNNAVESNYARQYDEILVHGERVKSQFHLSYRDATLEPAWTAAEEQAYRDGAKNHHEYDVLTDEEKAFANDAIRASDEFAHVFTQFRIPADWDWLIKDGEGNDKTSSLPGTPPEFPITPNQPLVNTLDDGRVQAPDPIFQPTFAYQNWRHKRPFLRETLMLEGVNYAYEDWGNYDYTLTRSSLDPAVLAPKYLPGLFPEAPDRAEFRPGQLLLKVAGASGRAEWYNLEKAPGLGSGFGLSRDGTQLRLLSNPNHIWAVDDWAGAEPTSFDPQIEGFNYRDLIFVVAIRLDQRLSVRLPVPGAVPRRNPRVLTIHVPGVECHVITPYSVVGLKVDENSVDSLTGVAPNGLAYAPSTVEHVLANGKDIDDYAWGVVRNDVWILRAVGAVALEWWGKPRVSVQINIEGDSIRGFADAAKLKPGTFVRRLDASSLRNKQDVNSVITRIISVNTGTVTRTTIQTGVANVQPMSVVQGEVRSISKAHS